MVKKRGLGKSLGALLDYTGKETAAHLMDETVDEKLTNLSINEIKRGKYQPRREMDPQSLEELAASIRSQGIIQPLVVRPSDGQYEIIAGERRWRAAKLAGLLEVPVIIRTIPDEAAVAIALIENIQRENLNPIEEALALQRLIDEFGMVHQQAADAVGKSRATITNLLRLLSLPEEIKLLLERKIIEMGHARTLLTLPEALQIQAAEMIMAKKLSVRETENLVRQLQASKLDKSKKPLDPSLQRLQEGLSHQIKLPVSLYCNAKGKGKIVIHYQNLNELDNLLAQMGCV